MFVIIGDETPQRNGDLAIRSDKGRLAAIVYSRGLESETRNYANVICNALNTAFSPGHTDLMVSPECLDAWMDQNPLPLDAHPDQTSPMTVGPEAFLEQKTVFYEVADLDEFENEPYALIRIDTEKRAGNGCEGTVVSLHWTRQEASEEAGRLEAIARA